MDVVRSVNGVPIRLTDERWDHIVARHEILRTMRDAVVSTVSSPFAVLDGASGELLAVARHGIWWIVVAYRELSEVDGFIITAFVTRANPTTGRQVVWPST